MKEIDHQPKDSYIKSNITKYYHNIIVDCNHQITDNPDAVHRESTILDVKAAN